MEAKSKEMKFDGEITMLNFINVIKYVEFCLSRRGDFSKIKLGDNFFLVMGLADTWLAYVYQSNAKL